MSRAGKFRWVICGLLFALVALSYIDRLTIGILKAPISGKLGWSDQDYGYVTAGFFLGYAFGYLFAGRAMDRLRVKRGLPLFVFVWSIAVAAHGLISFIHKDSVLHLLHHPWSPFGEKSFPWIPAALPMTAAGFVFARIILGLAEGANFPAAIRTVAEWFPTRERAYATGWFNAGTNVGAILCPIAVPWIYIHIGWPTTFYLTGLAGALWLIAWWFLYDEPEKHHRLKPEELDYIRSGQPQATVQRTRVSWLSLLRYRAVWAYLLASILAAPAWGFYQFFLPDFLQKRFHLGLQATGWWTSAFFALTGIGGIAGGWLAGSLLGRGWPLNSARKLSLLICALAVVPLFAAPFAPTVFTAVLIVGLAGGAHQGWSANLYSVVSDTMPRETISSTIGLGGFVCYFTGSVVSAMTGWILKTTGSYVYVFAYFSGTYLLSLVCLQLLVPKIADAGHKPLEPMTTELGQASNA